MVLLGEGKAFAFGSPLRPQLNPSAVGTTAMPFSDRSYGNQEIHLLAISLVTFIHQ